VTSAGWTVPELLRGPRVGGAGVFQHHLLPATLAADLDLNVVHRAILADYCGLL